MVMKKNKMKNKMKIIIGFMFILGLFSCSKGKEYDFQVKNQTKYALNEVSFDWCNGDTKISLFPKSSTNHILRYKSKGINIFGSGSLCITILKYSDTAMTYTNTIGVSFERNNLNKKSPNVIKITEMSSPKNSNIFTIELE